MRTRGARKASWRARAPDAGKRDVPPETEARARIALKKFMVLVAVVGDCFGSRSQ
jgi:hypothetical protein